MKIILIGANGYIGKHVNQALTETNHEIITVGRNSGQIKANIASSDEILKLYKQVGSFDAVVNASGEVAFAPLQELTKEQWSNSLQSKLLGQINLVQLALPFINKGGSFTLVSGVLGDEQIKAGVIAATVNKALEGFVQAAATELPNGLRINLISPTLLEDAVSDYGPFFPGFLPVKGSAVGQAYKKAIMGVQTGKVFKVY